MKDLLRDLVALAAMSAFLFAAAMWILHFDKLPPPV